MFLAIPAPGFQLAEAAMRQLDRQKPAAGDLLLLEETSTSSRGDFCFLKGLDGPQRAFMAHTTLQGCI